MKIKLMVILILIMAITACSNSIPVGWNRTSFEGELYSYSAYVIDMESGTVQFAKNETQQALPASTVKMMTALVTLEMVGEGVDLEELVEVPNIVFEAFDTDDPNTVGGSLSGFTAGQGNITYRDCLYGLMLPSGNDAANILAYNIGEKVKLLRSTDMYDHEDAISVFVGMMNNYAVELGCVNTNFTNAHGLLEPDNRSCAYDLAVIAKYSYEKFELFREICGTYEYVMPGNHSINPDGYRVRNSNGLIRNEPDNIYYRGYVHGIKNGALDYIYHLNDHNEWVENEGIANLVSIGEIDGQMYIIVTLQAPWKYGELGAGESRLHYSYVDHIALYDWLFEGS